jgi:hypothetical protein
LVLFLIGFTNGQGGVNMISIATVVISLISAFLIYPHLLMDYWGWFAVPMFDVKQLTYWHSLGLSTLAALPLFSLIVSNVAADEDLSENKKLLKVIQSCLTYLLIWAFGSFYHYMMGT